MRAGLTDPHARLLRAMRQAIGRDEALADWLQPGVAGTPGLVIEGFESTPWASLTFTGRRHRLAIALHGQADLVEHAYNRVQTLMDDPQIEMPGHILAEVALIESESEIAPDGSLRLTMLFEALTIEE
jgi:hypothetical protein